MITLAEVVAAQGAEVDEHDDADEELEQEDELALRDEVGLAGLVDQLGDLAHRAVDRQVLELRVHHQAEEQAEDADDQAATAAGCARSCRRTSRSDSTGPAARGRPRWRRRAWRSGWRTAPSARASAAASRAGRSGRGVRVWAYFLQKSVAKTCTNSQREPGASRPAAAGPKGRRADGLEPSGLPLAVHDRLRGRGAPMWTRREDPGEAITSEGKTGWGSRGRRCPSLFIEDPL